MCGICGELWTAREGTTNPDHTIAMREALVHRGPDSAGLFLSPDRRATLGFRRLRIIDLSAAADQPMPNEQGDVQVILNGEIYNFRELRRELLSRGHTFRSHSDTETIAHLYEDLGSECIERLDGMFALAILDVRRHRLILARDRAGKKPLFYLQTAERLVFASEIKAFFAHPDVRVEIDRDAIPYYFLHGYVPCPSTFYRGVRQVEPGSVIEFDRHGASHARAYWRLRFSSEREQRDRSVDAADAAVRVRELVTQAVERRMISDVPIGAFLSGGLDSTIVVGVMSQVASAPVKTFSIGFEGDSAYDETRYARIAADRFGTDHTEFVVRPSAIDLVDTLVAHHDGPFGDASAIPTYIVSELTRRHVTVVLTGDGSDELFAGYLRFYAAALADRMPAVLVRSGQTILDWLPTVGDDRHVMSRARRFLGAAGLPLYERMSRWSGLFYDDLERLLAPEFLAASSSVDRLRYVRGDLVAMADLSTLGKILHVNFRTYLLDDLLVKVDRCMMAHSLEGRSPFLDRDLVEYVGTLPDALKLQGRRTKVVLRRAFEDMVPTEIARRRKMGFGVPLGAWFRGDLREHLSDLLLSPHARYREYLSAPFVQHLVERHLSGRADVGLQLWSLVAFEAWLQAFPRWQRQSVPAEVRA